MTQREEHRSLYLSYLEYCNEHDFDRMASFYTSTIKVNDVPMDPAAVAAQFAPLFSAFPDWHWEIRNLMVECDYIAVHFTVTGTHRGAFQGIEATGRRVSISEFTFYRLEDGKFAEVWDHTDMDAVMGQIGQGVTAPEIAVEGALQIFSRLTQRSLVMNVTSSGANKDAVGAKTKDNSVRDTLAHLMLRNLSEVFGERDGERRMAAIKNLYSEDAVFFEAEQRFEGRHTISDAVAALQASFPAEFEFSAVAPPARNHDVGRLFWRLGPAGSPPVVNGMDVAQFKDGRIHSLYVFLNDEDH